MSQFGMGARAAAAVAPVEGAPIQPAPRRRVVVALHGRRPPVAAIRMGRLVARVLGAPLHGLLSWTAPLAPSEVPGLLRLRPEALEGLALDVHVGEPGDDLAAADPSSILVVTAEGGATASDPLGVGCVAARALTTSPAAVLLVREDAEPPERLARMLLPLDGTPSTAGAIGPAGELALEAHAALDIVYVGEGGHHTPVPPEAEPGSMRTPRYVDQPQHEWPAFSDEFLHRFLGVIGNCPPEVSTRMFLGAGDPAQEILRFARELQSDLLVLVWRGDLDNHHGDTFRRVVQEASRPILVLKR